MTTTATIPSNLATGPATDGPPRPVPFTRLLRVETRKLLDTRTGQIMTGVLLLAACAVMAARALVVGPELQGTITISGTVLGTLLPVLGILSVTSEWSHHTALTTFALEPRRVRVVIAKCFPPALATVLASAVIVAVAYPVLGVVSVVQGGRTDWTLDPAVILGWVVVNVILALSGVAIGTLLLNAPGAIVTVTMSTVVWNVVAYAGDAGATAAAWFDLNRTTAPLLSGGWPGGTDTQQLAVSLTAWIVVPLVLGGFRVIRREVR